MTADGSEIIAISKLLGKSTPPQVRKPALDLILGTSLHLDGLSLFSAEEFVLLDGLCRLLHDLLPDERQLVFSILVNVAAESDELSNRILESGVVINKCVEECVQKSSCLLRSAQLLANVSRHAPEKFHATISQCWSNHIAAIFDLLMDSSSSILESADYLGYVLMNLSTVHVVRQAIVTSHLPKLLALFSVSNRVKRKMCAVNVVYNISFEDSLHTTLLSVNEDDEFLCAIVAPLVDESYELSEEEIAKLPLQLQYYDRKREEDVTICQKLVETLYQLCATKLGRETLRTKGIYPLLRELDKATSKQSSWIKQTSIDQHYSTFENTLHSLIGILIRYESEMEVPNDAFSLRQLE